MLRFGFSTGLILASAFGIFLKNDEGGCRFPPGQAFLQASAFSICFFNGLRELQYPILAQFVGTIYLFAQLRVVHTSIWMCLTTPQNTASGSSSRIG